MTTPTEQEVYEYVRTHPGCLSKEIGAHFKCGKDCINKSRVGYCGIYRISGMRHEDFKHYVDVAEPIPAPQPVLVVEQIVVPEAVQNLKPPILRPFIRRKPECPICFTLFDHSWQLAGLGCCAGVLCRECMKKVSGKCPNCREPFAIRTLPEYDDEN